jgi:hypothetical protein
LTPNFEKVPPLTAFRQHAPQHTIAKHEVVEQGGEGVSAGQNDDGGGNPIVQIADQSGLAPAEGVRRRDRKEPEEAERIMLGPSEAEAQANDRHEQHIERIVHELVCDFG